MDGRNRFGVLSLGGGVGDVTASGRLIKPKSVNLGGEKGADRFISGHQQMFENGLLGRKVLSFFFMWTIAGDGLGGSHSSPRPRFTCVAV